MSKKPITIPSPPSEAEMAAPAVTGLTLDNLEDRVEHLRQASEPTRKARAATNRASRKEQQRRLVAKSKKET
jgi:hypothetical protein